MLLALETSTIACSVALLGEGDVIERHEVRAKEHTRLLVPMIEEVLAEGGISAGELEAIVLGNGPGSFIGMRIAASVAQGLAYGAKRGIVPVSSLAAVAAEAFEQTAAERVLVAQDAHMNEVYLARFVRGRDRLPVAEGDIILQPVGSIELDEQPWLAAGAGWQRYPQLLRLNAESLSGQSDVTLPRASFLLALGRVALRNGAIIDPASLTPDYVRHKVASLPGGAPP